jgi:TetR/AcrR family transcriptional regulator, transcriptional repressor for nem operon
MDKTYASFQSELEDGSSFDLNYYSLIFDAIRMFPEFKNNMIASNNTELEAWVNVIHTAKTNDEISSPMADIQIANVFIHTNSGVGMNNIMTGKSEKTTKDLLTIWDSFYAQLKR